MTDFLAGGTAVAALAVALFFLRFWHRSGDRFFALFALAFAVFAGNRVLFAAVDADDESRPWIYVVRLVAFLLILAAIVDKNRQPSSAARRAR